MGSAIEGPMIKLAGAIAGAGLNTAATQYTFVKLSGDLTVVPVTSENDIPCGVLQAPAAEGDAAEVCAIGQTQVRVSEEINAGAPIASNSDGKAFEATKSGGTVTIVGQMLRKGGATADNNIATALVNCAVGSFSGDE